MREELVKRLLRALDDFTELGITEKIEFDGPPVVCVGDGPDGYIHLAEAPGIGIYRTPESLYNLVECGVAEEMAQAETVVEDRAAARDFIFLCRDEAAFYGGRQFPHRRRPQRLSDGDMLYAAQILEEGAAAFRRGELEVMPVTAFDGCDEPDFPLVPETPDDIPCFVSFHVPVEPARSEHFGMLFSGGSDPVVSRIVEDGDTFSFETVNAGLFLGDDPPERVGVRDVTGAFYLEPASRAGVEAVYVFPAGSPAIDPFIDFFSRLYKYTWQILRQAAPGAEPDPAVAAEFALWLALVRPDDAEAGAMLRDIGEWRGGGDYPHRARILGDLTGRIDKAGNRLL